MTTPSPRPPLSVDAIRDRFPALRRTHQGHPVAYFDGPGGTQVPDVVVDAMADYLFHHNANTHWAYPTSAETDALILEARQAAADFVNGQPSEIVFGQNMTTLTFHLARGLGRAMGPGDEIVVTDLDHHANRAPWEDLVRERRTIVRVVPFDPATGTLDQAALERALGPRTRLLAIGAASNALGTVTDVAPACRLARATGALSFVDAVHLAPHTLLDVAAMECDFLACSPYKFYGPHAGLLWGREALLADVAVPRLMPAPDTAPERVESGTLSHEAIVGTHATIDFLARLGASNGTRRTRLAEAFGLLHRRSDALFRHLWEGLASIPGVTLYGPGPDRPRTPTVAFTVEGLTAAQVTGRLAGRGLFTSHGDFYAATVVERLGVEGLVRAGIACYTTEEEVERLVEGVEHVKGAA